MAQKLGEVQRSWIEKAESDGWTVKVSLAGHLLFIPPASSGDSRPVPVPGRGFKNNRGLKNARAQLRRAGLKLN